MDGGDRGSVVRLAEHFVDRVLVDLVDWRLAGEIVDLLSESLLERAQLVVVGDVAARA